MSAVSVQISFSFFREVFGSNKRLVEAILTPESKNTACTAVVRYEHHSVERKRYEASPSLRTFTNT